MSEETVEVTIRLPKPVFDFYEDQTDNLEKFLVNELVDNCSARIDGVTPKMIADKYPGLKQKFQQYGLYTKHL